MPALVVYALEEVDVDHDQRQRRRDAARGRDLAFARFVEEPAVVHLGQVDR
jgi:hypothetical protein